MTAATILRNQEIQLAIRDYELVRVRLLALLVRALRSLRDSGDRHLPSRVTWPVNPCRAPPGFAFASFDVEGLVAPFVNLVKRSSSWGELIASAFRATCRASALTVARSTVEDAERRWFVALLLNVQAPSAIYRFVSERFPDADPVDTVFAWAKQLCCDESALGLRLSKPSVWVATRLARGQAASVILAELNALRKEPLTLADLAHLEAELRGSCLAPLFLAAT